MNVDAIRAMRPEDVTPNALEKARDFFKRYDALERGDRNQSLNTIAEDVGIDRSTAFRWTRFVRTAAQEAGYAWPFVTPDGSDLGAAIPELKAETPWKGTAPKIEQEIKASGNPELQRLYDILKEREKQLELPDDEGDHDNRLSQQVVREHEAAGDILDGLAAGTIALAEGVPQVVRLAEKTVSTEELEAFEENGFVVFLSQKQAPLFVPSEADVWMRKAYSNWDGYAMRVGDICEAVGMTETEFRKYRSLKGWTRSMNPLAPQAIIDMELDEITDEIVRMKEAAVRQRLKERQRKEDEKDAKKWRDIKGSVVASMRDVVADIPSIQLGQAPIVRPKKDEGRYRLILPLNDWQIGSHAEGEALRFGEEFSSEIADRMVDDYVRQLSEYLDRNAGATFGQPIICLLGDILHGLTGETTHGTKLAKHMRDFDWAQMRRAVELINRIADVVMSYFGDMKIIALPGNHDGAAGQVLGEMIYQRWRLELSEDDYVAPNNRTAFEMVGNSLFVFDHGASHDSGVHGGKIARSGPRRDLQIKDLVFARADLVDKARRSGGGIYFVMGDQHHTIDESANGVELIKLPAMPSGDVYADHNGWWSRPAQAVLLVDEENGLRHMERFYFDHQLVFPN